MKTTNFTSPKHGAIIHLTKEEGYETGAALGAFVRFANCAGWKYEVGSKR